MGDIPVPPSEGSLPPLNASSSRLLGQSLTGLREAQDDDGRSYSPRL